MKKIIAVIPITILFILLSFNYEVWAYTYNEFDFAPYKCWVIRYLDNSVYEFYMCYSTTQINITDVNNGIYISGLTGVATCQTHSTPDLPYNDNFSVWKIGNDQYFYDSFNIYAVVGGVYNGDKIEHFDNDSDFEDFLHPPEPPQNPTWYDEMFDEFVGAIEGIASVVTGGFTNLVEAFTEFWVIPVGGDEGDMFFPTNIPIASPTPTPTPIQYQTVIAPTTDPQGNVVYEYKYIYNNPSGTPIVASSPPVNNNGGGESFDYPYYENPDNRNNPYKLKIPWYLKLIFGDKIVDETTLDDSVNVIQDYMNDDDINDGVTTVYDGMDAIPTDWLILIGVIASIPLFGCLISRLLS